MTFGSYLEYMPRCRLNVSEPTGLIALQTSWEVLTVAVAVAERGGEELSDLIDGGRVRQEVGKPVAHTFVSDKLDEIVRRRRSVAHTASALDVSRADIRESVRFLRTLVHNQRAWCGMKAGRHSGRPLPSHTILLGTALARLLDAELTRHIRGILR